MVEPLLSRLADITPSMQEETAAEGSVWSLFNFGKDFKAIRGTVAAIDREHFNRVGTGCEVEPGEVVSEIRTTGNHDAILEHREQALGAVVVPQFWEVGQDWKASLTMGNVGPGGVAEAVGGISWGLSAFSIEPTDRKPAAGLLFVLAGEE